MALTGLHHYSCDPLAKAVLDGKCTSVRAMAAWALMQINTAILAKTFVTAFEQRDWTVISQAFCFFIAQGRPGAESVLIEALRQINSKKLALDFCCCSNDSLAKASAAWARGQAIVEWPDEPLQRGRPQCGQAPAMYPWFNPKSRHFFFS